MVAAEGLVDFHLGGSKSISANKEKSVETKSEKKEWKKRANEKNEK